MTSQIYNLVQRTREWRISNDVNLKVLDSRFEENHGFSVILNMNPTSQCRFSAIHNILHTKWKDFVAPLPLNSYHVTLKGLEQLVDKTDCDIQHTLDMLIALEKCLAPPETSSKSGALQSESDGAAVAGGFPTAVILPISFSPADESDLRAKEQEICNLSNLHSVQQFHLSLGYYIGDATGTSDTSVSLRAEIQTDILRVASSTLREQTLLFFSPRVCSYSSMTNFRPILSLLSQKSHGSLLKRYFSSLPSLEEESVRKGNSSQVSLFPVGVLVTGNVVTLILRGFPLFIEGDVKGEMIDQNMSSSLFGVKMPEPRGSQWAKVTLGALNRAHVFDEGRAHSLNNLAISLGETCEGTPPFLISTIALVQYTARSLQPGQRLSTIRFLFSSSLAPDDLFTVSAESQRNSQLRIEETKQARSSGACQNLVSLGGSPTGKPFSSTHYTSSIVAASSSAEEVAPWTCVLEIFPRGYDHTQNDATFERTVMQIQKAMNAWLGQHVSSDESDLSWCWFDKESLHCTVRGLEI